MVAPENIELFLLLPYTPELNLTEMIWDEVREKGFRNEIFKHLKAVIDRFVPHSKVLAKDVQRVATITHYICIEHTIIMIYNKHFGSRIYKGFAKVQAELSGIFKKTLQREDYIH